MKYTLQKIAIACTLLATISLQSCDKVKDAVKTPDISFSGASTDVVIPATSDTLNETTMNTVEVSYNIDSMVKATSGGTVSYSSIKTVKITKMTLTLNDADASNNFGNFITAAGKFNTNANGGTLPTYTVANITNNPATNVSTLDMPLVDKDKDLKQYFGSGTVVFKYALTGKLRHATTKELHCHVEVSYNIGF